MPLNRFDQASRYAAKLNAAGYVSWLLSEPLAALRYQGWLDTRTLPFPGDPERICDTVAHLRDADPDAQWALPIEFSLAPDSEMFGRLLVYLGQLWLERRPTPEPGSRYQVGAVVVNLTGRGHASRDWRLRQTGIRTCLQVVERNLAEEDATVTLAGIAAGAIDRCLLPWIPLMQGSAEPAILAQWVELGRTEPDAKLRADYGGLALVFAEAAGCRPAWKDALKEWNMVESQQVLEWIAEGEVKGEVKGTRNALVRYLEKHFPPGPPPDLLARIQSSTDPGQLAHWFEIAMSSPTLEAFQQAINQNGSP